MIITSLKYFNRRRTRASRVAAAELDFQDALKRLNKDEICIDCGANIGKITSQFASRDAQVYAFEPDPEAFRKLSANFGSHPNVILANAAVGTCDKDVLIYRSKRFSSGSRSHTTSTSLFNESYRVSDDSSLKITQIDFGNFLDKLPQKPALLKIDIEGAEVDLMEMLLSTGRLNGIGRVFVETHEKQMPSLRKRTFDLIKDVRKAGHNNINFDWG